MNSTSEYAIPTIDVGPLSQSDLASRAHTIRQVGEAAETYGFMKLVNHTVPRAVVEDTFSAARDFFEKPEDFKARYTDRGTNRGFRAMFDLAQPGKKPSAQESFSMGHPHRPSDPALLVLPGYGETPWPDVPLYQERLERTYVELFKLGELIMEAFAIHLGRRPDFFASASRDTYSSMRVNHYPPHEKVQHVSDAGIEAHEDRSLLTLLIQDMNGGLNVLGPDKSWLPVIPDEHAIVLNVGQLLTRWSNGRLRSAMHHVINRSGNERYSIPLFFHPNFNQVVDPEDFVRGKELNFDPVVAGDYVYTSLGRNRKAWIREAADQQREAAGQR